MSRSGYMFARVQWVPPQPEKTDFEQRCQDAKKQPFLDQQLLRGPPACAWSNFSRPLLRKYDLQHEIEYKKRLGYGMDGIVWTVEIGDCTLALKVFWDNTAPEETRYWAVQRECQNAALLQMIQAASTAGPIYLQPEPKTHRDAVANLRAFSDEGRRKRTFQHLPNAVSYTSVPRLRECFGWVKVSGRELCGLGWDLRPPSVVLDGLSRKIRPAEEYYAIVYEFIPEEQLRVDVIQSQLDLFWLAGFCLVPMQLCNWKGPGVLVDLADLICPWHTPIVFCKCWWPHQVRSILYLPEGRVSNTIVATWQATSKQVRREQPSAVNILSNDPFSDGTPELVLRSNPRGSGKDGFDIAVLRSCSLVARAAERRVGVWECVTDRSSPVSDADE
ncbi:hypothetical protein NKR23_g12445 [Pleurostoma richardsiae]|uniref:Uncharacterized protein n=1 Tax=Pleurostoma richardsiae TaxID=41990 RepID=A0AA38R5V3_9PEZI|nr:hypothetical protein NKR23_g12445 [Pleurostoma richardsiae]